CLQGQTTLFKAEEAYLRLVNNKATETFGQALEKLDDQLYQKVKEKHAPGQIHSLSRDSRTISFCFGTVQFKRRYVEMPDGSRVYLLDEALAIQARRQFSPLLMAKTADMAADVTMRQAAKAVTGLTNCSVTAPAVDNIVRATGQDLALVRTQEAKEEEEAAPGKRKAVKELYIEGDAFMVRGRCTRGRRNHRQRNLPFMHTVHRFQVYEGVAENGSRRTLVNRHEVSHLNRVVAIRELAAYVMAHYDLRETTVFTGSDNGSGYEREVFADLAAGAKREIHVLDRYHLNRKITKRLAGFPDGIASRVQKAAYTADKDAMTEALDTCQSLAAGNETGAADRTEDVRLLRAYLSRNWSSIEPLADPTIYRQTWSLGCCESNHRRYTYRLKHQGRAWSKAGLEAMLRIIDAEQNADFFESLQETELLGTTFMPEVAETAEKDINLQALGLFKALPTKHVGVRHGGIGRNTSTSSAMGQLNKQLNMGSSY
ncbi:ISLre2 family transposase, partial [Schleiferilactobacillus shenzhenensis]|uniref:ISLre2 family transposase n=1 Tax=Schleiferilactobacillus shenzhenensis TaxID=1231337 RepID=UPI0006925D2E